MRSKYVIQIKRYKLWEDLVTYTDKVSALATLFNLRNNNKNFQFRLLEVLCIL